MKTWDSPTPVVICAQGVRDGQRRGIVVAQRAIPPGIGEWSLISGHIEKGETIEEGGAREFMEETSVAMGTNVRIVGSRFNQFGHLLAWVTAHDIHLSTYEATAKPCSENLALDIAWTQRDLVFPIHSELSRRWFLGAL